MSQIKYDLEVLSIARRIADRPDAVRSEINWLLHDESVYQTQCGKIVKSYLAPETRIELKQIMRKLPRKRQ